MSVPTRSPSAPFVPASAAPASPRPRHGGRAALIPFEKHVLANGLEVVLHEDHSEPVVAVHVLYHVGSSRESHGRSGFAHLFEHMLFQGSAHVEDDGHFRRIQEAGGTLNGTTNQDRTTYFETLPSNQLELALWLESDRMGFLLPAMTQEKLANQIEVVKNERRQSYENRPYGLVHETLLAALHPPGHPYSWPTIGSMADIEAATLEDVAAFFRRFYGPNNATLVLGGDLDPRSALELVERYFGSLPLAPPVERPVPIPVQFPETRRVVLEDRVTLPQLTLCWPTVAGGHPDEAALDLLADVLSANRSALLDRVLLIEEELASSVTIAHAAQERAGQLVLELRPNPGVSLAALERRVEELLDVLVEEGVPAESLARLRRRREGALFRSLETIAARTARLAHDSVFHGDPGWIEEELARQAAVTVEDVARVARCYLVGRPRVVLSTVPAGKRELAAGDAPPARAERPAELDRSRAPSPAPERLFRSPPIWTASLPDGLQVLGSPFLRVPLARLSLSLPAGRRAETERTQGLASLTAEMLEEGTRSLSGVELTEALDGMGAEFGIAAGDDDLVLRVAVLEQHLAECLALLAEVVLEPRFAREDFERVRRQRLVALEARADRIAEIAEDAYARRIHGQAPRGFPRLGTRESIERCTVEDVRRFWREHALPGRSRVCFVGREDARELAALLEPLSARWSAPARPDLPGPASAPPAPGLFLVDKPGAAQSELRIGHLGVASTDPDFYPLQALNTVLGGSFSGRINMNLREDKGYTYGARSAFEGGSTPGAFTVSSAVHTRFTAQAVAEVVEELRGIRRGVTPDELEFARRLLSQSLQRSLESAQARLLVLEQIARHGYPLDYLERRLSWLRAMTREELDALAVRHVHPEELVLLVVGDRSQVLEPLRALGNGPVIELDSFGQPR